MKQKQKIFATIFGIIFIFALVSGVLAGDYCLLPMTKGQTIHITDTRSYTCTHTVCQVCAYTSNLWEAPYIDCNGPGVKLCGSGNNSDNNSSNSSLVFSADFPFSDGAFLTKQNFNLNVHTNQICEIDLINNVFQTQKTLCPNCDSYTQSQIFSQGFNNITVRAVCGNQIKEKTITFTIDNKPPIISSTLPKANSYSGGNFSVSYVENYVKEVDLYYGLGTTAAGATKKVLTGCDNGTATCLTSVNLSALEGKQINYWFTMTSMGNNTVSSNPVKFYVDTNLPVIQNFSYTIDKKNVDFVIKTSGNYVSKETYIDYSDSRPSERTLCTSLKNNVCDKKVSFSEGDHNVTIFVYDKSGAVVSKNTEFFIDSISPVIKSVSPTSGYANGNFNISFTELNPKSVVLSYGNYVAGQRTSTINLSSCSVSKGLYSCSVFANLSSYNYQSISYSFTVADIKNNSATTKVNSLNVDTILPVINKVNFTVNNKTGSVLFNINITEKNLDKVYAKDSAVINRQILCTTLKNNICTGQLSFKKGMHHSVNITAFDKAGNSATKTVEFDL